MGASAPPPKGTGTGTGPALYLEETGFLDKCPWDFKWRSLQSLGTLGMAFKQLAGSLDETLTTLFLNAGVRQLLPSGCLGSFLRLKS